MAKARKPSYTLPFVPLPEDVKPPHVKPRNVREVGRRHPLLKNWPRFEWCPHAVGIVRNYPKSPEAYKALQERSRAVMVKLHSDPATKPTRAGVRDGMGRRKIAVGVFRRLAEYEAKKIVEYMEEHGMLEEPDNLLATEALRHAIEMVRDAGTGATVRQAMIKTILEYTKAKPAQKINLTAEKPEAWLDSIAVAAMPHLQKITDQSGE